jgi:N-acetylmuramoyl-L-alanine amidase
MKKIGLFVGHSRQGDSGAAIYNNKTNEHKFNSEIVDRVAVRLITLGVPAENVITSNDYKTSSYNGAVAYVSKMCKDHKLDYGVEFHFNSAGPTAVGHEYLCYEASRGSVKAARVFARKQQALAPFSRSRGDFGVQAMSSGRGSLMLVKTSCPFIITEPFFGSNKDEADFWTAEEGKTLLVEIYTQAIVELIGPIAKPIVEEPVIELPKEASKSERIAMLLAEMKKLILEAEALNKA